MSNARIQRARLRQVALREPYGSAARHLSTISSTDPVIPAATSAQQRLEGEIFCRLGYIHEPRTLDHADDPFVIERIHPTSDSMTLQLSRNTSGSALAYSLLPRWDSGSDFVDNGIVGLRYAIDLKNSAVRFFLLDQPGLVTFVVNDVHAFIRAKEELTERYGLRVAEGRVMTSQEVRADSGTDMAGPVASAFMRRYGLVHDLKPKWIDSWSSSHRFSVEISVHEETAEHTQHLIDRLVSPELTPTFTRLHKDSVTNYYHPMQLEGTRLELDLRITTL